MSDKAPQPIPEGLIALDVHQLMAALGVGRTTIWRLESQGRLRSAPGIGCKRYSRKMVEAFLAGESPGKGSK